MQSRQGIAIGLIMGFAIWNVACQAVASDTPSASPSPAVSETPIAANTETPTETIAPILTDPPPNLSPSPTRSTPTPTHPENFPNAQAGSIPLANFIFNGFDEECAPPCWYDLRINESKPEDIQHFFDTVLGFNGSFDFWAPHSDATINFSGGLWPIPGYISTGYQWIDPTIFDNIGIAAYLDQEMEKLQGIVLTWGNNSGHFVDFSLGKLFEELGIPSSILISSYAPEMIIIYDVGVVFHLSGSGNKICLGDTSFGELFPFGDLIITSDLTERINNLTKLETEYFGAYIAPLGLHPIEEITKTTTAGIVQSVLAGNETCLEFETD